MRTEPVCSEAARMKLTLRCVVIAAVLLVPSAVSFAGFLNIGASITPLAGACAWGDYDKDGDLDLAVAGADASTKYAKIYCNDGGVFTDIGASLPAVSPRRSPSPTSTTTATWTWRWPGSWRTAQS